MSLAGPFSVAAFLEGRFAEGVWPCGSCSDVASGRWFSGSADPVCRLSVAGLSVRWSAVVAASECRLLAPVILAAGVSESGVAGTDWLGTGRLWTGDLGTGGLGIGRLGGSVGMALRRRDGAARPGSAAGGGVGSGPSGEDPARVAFGAEVPRAVSAALVSAAAFRAAASAAVALTTDSATVPLVTGAGADVPGFRGSGWCPCSEAPPEPPDGSP